MREQPGKEDRTEPLGDDLESMRLEDLDGTLRGAPGRVDEPIRLEFDLLGELIYNLMRAITIAVFPATAALAATVAFWVMSVVPGIRAARTATLSSEAAYHVELRHTQPVLTELAAFGAPSADLETVYFAFADSRHDEARKAADIYLGVLSDQIDLVRGDDGERTRALLQLLGPATTQRRETSDAYLRWVEGVSSRRGRVAVLAGLVVPPSEVLEIYERPHPRAP